ncbi:MAG: isochorismatase family protein [Coriobacteriia bacterium]|nr:isochorismatase family protein [Coriobacteriia bacterium]
MSSSGIVSRESAVLVLVDMQDRLADVMDRRDAVVGASALLARVAGALRMPVIVTRQYPRGLGDTVPELADAVGSHSPVDKMTFDCLREPAFAEQLRATGRRQVVLTGMEAHICITQTALALLSAGYDVHVVADAVCSRCDVDRDVTLERLRVAGATVTVAESVIYEALGEAGTPEFRAVLELVKARPLG